MNSAAAEASAAVATAVSTANGYIAQANTEVTQAFGYAAQAFQAVNCGTPPTAPQSQPGISATGSG